MKETASTAIASYSCLARKQQHLSSQEGRDTQFGCTKKWVTNLATPLVHKLKSNPRKYIEYFCNELYNNRTWVEANSLEFIRPVSPERTKTKMNHS